MLTLNRSSRRLLATLTLGHLVNDFYDLVLPFLLPTLIVAFDLNFASAGMLALVTSLIGGGLQPLVGRIGDRTGRRRRLIVIGFSAFIVGLALVSVSVSIWFVLAAWLIFGLGQATFHAQSTTLLTHTFAAQKGRAMGIHGIGGAVGNFAAPLVIAGLVSWLNWRFASLVLIVPAVVIIGLILAFLPKSGEAKAEVARPEIPSSLWLLAAVFGLILMVYKAFLTFLPTYLVQAGWTLNQAGQIASLMLFVGFLAQPLGGMIYDRFGGRFIFRLSAPLMILALLVFRAESPIPILLPILLMGASATALFPVSLAMASDLAGKGNVGMNVGLVFGVSGLFSAVTPFLTGLLADQVGLEIAFQALIVFPGVAFALSFFLPAPGRGESQPEPAQAYDLN